MDCSMCIICRTLSRISLVCAVVIASLVLSPMRVSSSPSEQWCKARPTVVALKKAGYRPYHIELHQCSGTCTYDAPPNHRPCAATSKKAVTVELTDLTSSKLSTITVYNHTKCGCACELECKVEEGELPDEENCKCVILPGIGKSGNDKEKTAVNVLPYQIGLAGVGFFAVCVLVFDMILCGKDKGVLYKVKEKCCKSEQMDNKDVTLKNGRFSSKENPGTVDV